MNTIRITWELGCAVTFITQLQLRPTKLCQVWEKILIERMHGDSSARRHSQEHFRFFAQNVWKGLDFTMHFNYPEAKERIKWNTLVYWTFHGRDAIQFICLIVDENKGIGCFKPCFKNPVIGSDILAYKVLQCN